MLLLLEGMLGRPGITYIAEVWHGAPPAVLETTHRPGESAWPSNVGSLPGHVNREKSKTERVNTLRPQGALP